MIAGSKDLLDQHTGIGGRAVNDATRTRSSLDDSGRACCSAGSGGK